VLRPPAGTFTEMEIQFIMSESIETRRDFLQKLAMATSAVVLMPIVSACSGPDVKPDEQPTTIPAGGMTREPMAEAAKPTDVPMTAPEGWDPIAYNRIRGNAGFIPESYLPDVNGPDGELKHLGKHLPFVPAVDPALVPAGFIAVMWGNPDKGYAKHPNAPKSEANATGHWYNWINVRKATTGEAEELKSEYADWPGTDMVGKQYVAMGGGDIAADSGKNTVYMVALPKDVQKGDTVRIHAHCLTHGEYVDFLTV